MTLKSAFAIALLICSVSLATEGGISSGGGDLQSPDHGSAWFLGRNKDVRACLKVAPDFGYDTSKLQGYIVDSVAIWKQYAERKRVFEYRTADFIPATSLRFAECKGDEDLTFYFGVANDEVLAYRGRFDEPAAYAVRTKYDRKAGWGRGFVWIAKPSSLDLSRFPDFRKPEALQTLLTHELGRVLGVGNASGTIMDENLVAQIKRWEIDPTLIQGMNRIDYSKELVLCEDCGAEYAGKLWDAKVGAMLLGHDVPAGTKMKFRVSTMAGYYLDIEDGKKTETFPIFRPQHPEGASYIDTQTPAFLAVRLGPDFPGVERVSAMYRGMVEHGHVEARNGKRYSVIIDRNSAMVSPVKITIIDADQWTHPLFDSTL